MVKHWWKKLGEILGYSMSYQECFMAFHKFWSPLIFTHRKFNVHRTSTRSWEQFLMTLLKKLLDLILNSILYNQALWWTLGIVQECRKQYSWNKTMFKLLVGQCAHFCKFWQPSPWFYYFAILVCTIFFSEYKRVFYFIFLLEDVFFFYDQYFFKIDL